MLYTSTPGTTGGFTYSGTGSAGYQNFSQGLPWYQGRSQVATIPEFQRNPGLMEKKLMMKIGERGSNLAKILLQYAEKNPMEKEDVKFWFRKDIEPHPRLYLKAGAYASNATTFQTTFYLTDFTRPSQSYPTSTGNPKVIGNIARVQAGDLLLLTCSFLPSSRLGANAYRETYDKPVPELCKVVSVDYAGNSFVVERNWAGDQRTTARTNPTTFTVIANSAARDAVTKVYAKDAFFLQLPRSMKEDQIDSKVFGVTSTWDYGIMQRSLRAWGSGTLGEVVRRNLGLGSKLAEDKDYTLRQYYNEVAMAAIWGEKHEEWDSETGEWQGYTDGLLTTLNAGHFIGITPMEIGSLRASPTTSYGTFDIPVFNKFLQDKGYHSKTGHLVAVCGGDPALYFATMINQMTQNIPDIKSEWQVIGKRFRTSGGLTVDFVEEDAMTLNGMRNKMLLIDPSEFKMIKLKGYPTDIVEVNNENPLLKNGFIHGVYAFVNTNPDNHWVITLDDNFAAETGATYAANVLGVPQA